MSVWLLKTEPSVYSYDDLEREGATVWDGVANTTALKHIRAVQSGDTAIIYHTGDERRAVGLAEVTSAPYPDPKAGDPKLLVFDLRPLKRFAQPVTLAQVKADPIFATFELVRIARLSVMPVAEPFWARLLELAGD